MTEKNIFVKLNFILSALEIHQLPEDIGLEVALCGRSNSGKSSVLNALANNKSLARTSKTPGRTQSLNVFNFNSDHLRRLIDLPGYGFAKVSKKDRKNWGILISNYLNKRMSLRGLVLIMDIRHPLKDSDLTLLNWCEETNTSVLILLNKSDKISKNQSTNSRNTTLETLKHLKINTNAVVFSAKNHQGIDFLKKYLIDCLDVEGSPNALG